MTEYWQLKKPVKLYHHEAYGWYIEFQDGRNIFYGSGADELFEPADIETKRQQLEKIMDELGDYRDVESYWLARDRAVDAVLGVVGLTKETE